MTIQLQDKPANQPVEENGILGYPHQYDALNEYVQEMRNLNLTFHAMWTN